MQKRGMTAAGTQRWYCVLCKQSSIKRRLDHLYRSKSHIFVSWLTGNATLKDLSLKHKVNIRTIRTWLKAYWRKPVRALSKRPASILILDATGLSRICSLLIILNAETNKPISWWDAPRESYMSWQSLLQRMPQNPSYVVCDGHLGLIKAIRERWPGVLIQRCHAHILRETRSLLTRHPKLIAGIELKIIVNELGRVDTKPERDAWIQKFAVWQETYNSFLKERTVSSDGHWRYAHRNLRRVRTHLLRAMPDLFRYLDDPRVPRTSNQLEGGINSPIKDLVRKHRGLSTEHELILASLYLRKRAEKPPRDFH